jgi:dTDP-4-dehydrorhamnose 3,5-epimerase
VSQDNLIDIEGVKFSQIVSSSDSRGEFLKVQPEIFMQSKLGSVAVSNNPKAGTIRGIHLQIEPFAEEKIITCIQGSTFEVIIDLRPNSESFGNIATFELSRRLGNQVYLPKGIAHGFQTLMPDTILQYVLTSEYSPEHSYSIDPFGDLGIDWPLRELSLSKKDSLGVSFSYAAKKYADSLRT